MENDVMEFVVRQAINGCDVTAEEYAATKFPKSELIAQILEAVRERLNSTTNNDTA